MISVQIELRSYQVESPAFEPYFTASGQEARVEEGARKGDEAVDLCGEDYWEEGAEVRAELHFKALELDSPSACCIGGWEGGGGNFSGCTPGL